ncbi:MAG: Rieske (2Fe-2S) protein [Thermoplasmata archaeon]
MAVWHEIPAAHGLKHGEMTHAQAGPEDVLILNVDGDLRAYINRFGHMNAPLDLGTFKSGVLKCAQHNAVFDAKTGEVRGPPVLSMPGVDLSKLPKEFTEAMARMAPIFERTKCLPLTPLPLSVVDLKVRAWV